MSNVPSRQFLIQQSVLNAALPYSQKEKEDGFLLVLGMASYLEGLVIDGYVRTSFCDQVRKEYRLLASRYQERNAA